MKTFKQHTLQEVFMRQHYDAVAKAINTAMRSAEHIESGAEVPIEILAETVAEIFDGVENYFDKRSFLSKCGL